MEHYLGMKMTNKKIVFMGTPSYATEILIKLYEENYDIVALYTQPDKKVGRKQLLTPPHIKKYCIDEGLSLPINQPQNLKSNLISDDIKNYNPDFIIVAAYGQILPKNILDIAPCINLHASLLPKYRGASPIQQSILNNDNFTGVTSMLMEEGLDSGDVLGLKYVNITKDMDIEQLFTKLSIIAGDLIIETLNNFTKINPKKQDISQVSFCGKISKDDGLIKFNNANKIYQKFKAYKYWPGLFLNSQLKIKDCCINETNTSNIQGEILSINNESIIVGCTKGSVVIKTVQPASKKQMNVLDYIRGKRLDIGNILS
jgi:methionyl-tRNA formyltransferase